jgi:hypothetical protein
VAAATGRPGFHPGDIWRHALTSSETFPRWVDSSVRYISSYISTFGSR